MSNSTLSRRGAYANNGAKLPGLQGMRLADPQAQKAFEGLREWVEVRLGSRGDKYERAVTLRELEKLLEPIEAKLAELSNFNGNINSLSTTKLSALPTAVTAGSFAMLTDGTLYVADGLAWRQITLI